jgi:hypothetical protein
LMLASINPPSSATVVGVGTGVAARVGVGVALGTSVADGVDVAVDVGRGVDVGVDVGTGADVLVAVPVALLGLPGAPPAMPGVPLPLLDEVGVGVAVDVAVGGEVGPVVAVEVGVRVAVEDGVATARRDGPNEATEKLSITRSAGPIVAVDVGLAVGVGVAVAAAAVSAAKTVKCEDSPVTVPAAWLTVDPPATGRQLALAVSKKNTPAGGDPLNASVTWTGCAKVLTCAPLAPVAVSSTALLTSCCPPLSGGALVRAIWTVVFWATAPAGNTT